MKKIYTLTLIGLLLLLALPSMADDSSSNRVKLDDSKLTFKSDGVHKSLWWDDSISSDQDKQAGTYASDTVHYFTGRYALVGAHCMINRSYTTVSVGAFTNHLDYLTDDTLTNHTTMSSVADVGLGYKPVVSVRDMEHHFAKGTTAGFCLASKGSKSVLKLDVGSTYVLNFYREGSWVGMVNAKSGKTINGLSVKLISLPSSDSLVYNIEAKAPAEFDEVEFGIAGAASVDVASMLKLKYAFVGGQKMYTLTNRDKNGNKASTIPDFRDYLHDNGRDEHVTIQHDFSFLGLKDNATNTDLTDGFPIVLPVEIGWGGGMSIYATTISTDRGEFFKKGSIVGIDMNGGGLDINVASGVKFDLLDQYGNTIKNAGHLIGDGVVGIDLGGGDRSVSMEAGTDFSGVKVNFLKVLGVNVSATVLKYAFVSPAPKLFPDAHHCPIEASADRNMCKDVENSIKLTHNPDIPVKWSVKAPEGASTPTINQETQEVTGMTGEGDYVFTATSLLDNTCTETVTIHRGEISRSADTQLCETPITKDDAELANTQASDSSADTQEGQTKGGGSLLSLSGWSGKDNILDGNENTYAEYTQGLKLAANVRIITIKAKDNKTFRQLMYEKARDAYKSLGETKMDSAENAAKQDSMYVGFVMQMNSTGLNLKLLEGFRIACYKDGKEVCNHFVSQSNILGLQLIKKEQIQKLEFAITVPKDSDFDSFSLWTSGVLALDLSHLRIYYPFYERGSEVETCSNPLNCGAIQINNKTTGAKVSTGGVDISKTGGLADVASMLENLSFAVDDDPDYKTYMTIGGVAKVAGQVQVGIKLGRTYDMHHRLAIVMDAPNDVLTADVGSWMTVKTYNHGKATGDEKKNWTVLGVDLIKTGDKSYFLWSPKHEYDEVVITFGQVAKVLDFYRLYGIAVQSDVDADGVPDCKDASSCDMPQVQDVKMEPVCYADKATITWKGVKDKGAEYIISLPDQKDGTFITSGTLPKGASITSSEISGDEHSRYLYTFTVPAGVLKKSGKDLQVYIENLSDSILGTGYYTVHPQIARWKVDAPTKDWNEWSNWENGSPYKCTDVVIPTDAKRYPVLTDLTSLASDKLSALTDSDKNNWNSCHGIHFCPDAAVENVYRLTYDSAWVDLGLKNGIYRMYMAPLRSVYSGDFFVSEIPDSLYFTPLVEKIDAENRVKPYVYQRLWDKVLTGQQIPMTNDGAADVDNGGSYSLLTANEASWSEAFNAISTDYSSKYSASYTELLVTKTVKDIAPNCFSLMIHDTNDSTALLGKTYVIHLPKDGTRQYHYYDYDGKPLTEKDLAHSTTDNYKLWADATTWKAGNNNEITLNYFCDLSKASTKDQSNGSTNIFLVGNPLMSHLSLGPFIKENSNVTGVKVYDGNTTYSVITIGDKLVSTNNQTNGDSIYVGPSQAFFVKTAKNISANSSFQLTYKADMYGHQPLSYDQTYHSGNKGYDGAKALFTSADDEPAYLRVKASNGQNNVSTILLQGVDQKLETLIDEKYKPNLAAFSMEGNQAYDIRPVDADVIDLGFYTSDSCDVQLSFETSGNFNTDDWRLYDRSTDNCYRLDETPVVTMNGANVGRFYLSRIGAVTGIHQAKAADGVSLNVAEGIATVKSDGNDLTAVYVYDESGSLVDEKQLSNARQATLHVAPGVNIVKVCRAGKADKSYKVMGR